MREDNVRNCWVLRSTQAVLHTTTTESASPVAPPMGIRVRGGTPQLWTWIKIYTYFSEGVRVRGGTPNSGLEGSYRYTTARGSACAVTLPDPGHEKALTLTTTTESASAVAPPTIPTTMIRRTVPNNFINAQEVPDLSDAGTVYLHVHGDDVSDE
ncbi:hypothetical protein N9L68_08350 [bacterium]|nr:hypothetical protein [bacterium]